MPIKARLDLGNNLIKGQVTSDIDTETSFPNAIQLITETEWKKAVRTGSASKHHIKVQGIPYVIGDMALRRGIAERPRGAARYNEQYFGVALCYVLASLYGRTSQDLIVYASHAPRDVEYVPNIKAAAKGNAKKGWDVEYMGKEFNFKVSEVLTLDEPLGGFNNFVLTDAGKPVKDNPIKNKTVLVLDIGGYTTDTVAVDPGGQIDITTFYSQVVGAINVMDIFEEGLRANNRTAFQKAGILHPARLRQAFMTGVFEGGGKQIDCKQEADEAANLLLNDIDIIFQSRGGLINYDGVIGTGGFYQVMQERLQLAYPDIPFYASEADPQSAHLSNLRGMRKVFDMMENLQKLMERKQTLKKGSPNAR